MQLIASMLHSSSCSLPLAEAAMVVGSDTTWVWRLLCARCAREAAAGMSSSPAVSRAPTAAVHVAPPLLMFSSSSSLTTNAAGAS